MTVKEHKTKPYGGDQTSWLTVLCANDPQKLQTIRQKIDNYCKKSVGSSDDDRKLNSQVWHIFLFSSHLCLKAQWLASCVDMLCHLSIVPTGLLLAVHNF